MRKHIHLLKVTVSKTGRYGRNILTVVWDKTDTFDVTVTSKDLLHFTLFCIVWDTGYIERRLVISVVGFHGLLELRLYCRSDGGGFFGRHSRRIQINWMILFAHIGNFRRSVME